MIEWRTRILCGLLVLLAAAPAAIPQTAQSRAPTRQVAVRKRGKSGDNGSSSATSATPGALPGLCFQPGVGWQRILPEPHAAPGTHGSMGQEVSRSTSAAPAQSISARSSNAQQAAECAGSSINTKALGAGVENLTVLNHPQTMRSAGAKKPGMATSLHGNSPYRVPGRVGLEPVVMIPGAMPAAAPTYFASEAESDAHPDQVGVRAFHAYTSSIKLRRLIRNAPDFRTRIQLQQLQSSPQLHKAWAATKTGAAASGPLQGERANRTSSPRPDAHHRPRGNPRKLFSGVYR
jgi:hypothetical protein